MYFYALRLCFAAGQEGRTTVIRHGFERESRLNMAMSLGLPSSCMVKRRAGLTDHSHSKPVTTVFEVLTSLLCNDNDMGMTINGGDEDLARTGFHCEQRTKSVMSCDGILNERKNTYQYLQRQAANREASQLLLFRR